MSHLESLQRVIEVLESAKIDADKFDRGNASAGTRLRKSVLEARKDLEDIRRSVQATKKSRKGG